MNVDPVKVVPCVIVTVPLYPNGAIVVGSIIVGSNVTTDPS